MEVEPWISVQARREKFEQLYEDSPLSPCSQKCTSSHIRPRTSSNTHKDVHNSESFQSPCVKQQHLREDYEDQKLPKEINSSESCSKSSVSSNSRKHSKNSFQKKEQINFQCQEKEEHAESGNEFKQSSGRRIPPLAAGSTPLNGKNFGKTETSVSDSQAKRGRFFTHIRSKSHGNFITKRDSSLEKSSPAKDKNGAEVQKENKFHKDWLTPKRKQRSIDNLLGNQDSKCNSSFEGKQKLVSNVVKNMKNKEKPIVLRKISFSSKTEKNFSNMKEKSVFPTSDHKHSASLLTSADKTVAPDILQNKQRSNSNDSGIIVDHKLIGEDRHKISYTSEAAVAPVLIAKAVADVALKKSEATTDTIHSVSSLSSEETLPVPPARPPRRRGAGPSPRRKGKAPSPPSHSSSPQDQNLRIYDETSFKVSLPGESSNISTNIYDECSQSPEITKQRLRKFPDVYRSCESLSSLYSADKSRESSPEMTQSNSTPNSKLTKVGASRKCTRSPFKQQDKEQNIESKLSKPRLPVHLGTSNTSLVADQVKDKVLIENNRTDLEGLPCGPPPKKPPRTFAYDIYKNGNMSKAEGEDEESSKREKEEEIKNTQPIYAVPVKKKNKALPKPPVRSKSDLSKEVIKPSVAPKPPHVLAKAKRTSLVDPLSTFEKDEEAAITSEFQRQAHIRYSLRRPKKPPPTPPPYCNVESNTPSDSNPNSKLTNTSWTNTDNHDYSTVDCNSVTDHFGSECARHQSTGSPALSSENHAAIESPEIWRRHKSKCCLPDQNMHQSDYEEVTPAASSTGAASCFNHKQQPLTSSVESEQPLSLTYCFVSAPSPSLTHHNKRSMSDETLYKGSRCGEEPVYATPMFKASNQHLNKTCQKELHYMCSVLFTDDEEADAGRDRGDSRYRRNSTHGREKILETDNDDGNKGKSSLISVWKREFRQSCRQVQSKIKKTVIR